MLDSSALEIAGYDPVHSPVEDDNASPHTPLTAVAGCFACHEAMGACAVHLAKAGHVAPSTALAICGAMQRLARRAVSFRSRSATTYVAYVWLGGACRTIDHEAEAEALAERMR